jgi:hypothetical protein
MVDITFHALNKENPEMSGTTNLSGDVVLFISPLLEDCDDFADTITKVNAIFDKFSNNKTFTLLYCVVSHNFIIKNTNLSHRLKSRA